MLIVSEIAEATEEIRNGNPDVYYANKNTGLVVSEIPEAYSLLDFKPEGEAVELVDAVVRIMDYFGAKGWDMEAILRAKIDYNKTRGYRHGKKA